MSTISRANSSKWHDPTWLALSHKLTSIIAMSMLIILILSNVFLWPIPYLGFDANPFTAIITFVQSDSSAAQAGLQIGDHILQIHGHPWEDTISRFNIFSLIDVQSRSIPIVIERAGVVQALNLALEAPSISFQLSKLSKLLVAWLCWMTGYILGIVRRHETSGSPIVAYFWFGLSGVVGSYLFASYASFPLMMVLRWLIITVFAPLSIYVHVWFPIRPITSAQAERARRNLFIACIGLNVCLAVMVLIWRPSLIAFVYRLSLISRLSLLVGLGGSAFVLQRAYQQSTIEHVRRQIRLIAVACVFVGIFFLLTLILPILINRNSLIPPQWIDVAITSIPLAYLMSGIIPDLYRLDRFALRLGMHAVTITILIGVLATLTTTWNLQNTAATLWLASCGIVFYRMVYRTGLRYLPIHLDMWQMYAPLREGTTKFTTSLEPEPLIDVVCEGIQTTFGQPALAFYLGDSAGSDDLTLMRHHRFPDLPRTILPGSLTEYLCEMPRITTYREIYTTLKPTLLTATEEQIIWHSQR